MACESAEMVNESSEIARESAAMANESSEMACESAAMAYGSVAMAYEGRQMMMEKKVALVTGGTRGIGLGIADQLADDGYLLTVTGMRPWEEVEETIRSLERNGQPVLYVQGDISSPISRRYLINTALTSFGRIDVLVNNAGIAPAARRDLLEMTEESMDRVLGVNLKGTFFLTQQVANMMIRLMDAEVDLQPVIVNISSVSSYAASTERGEYCISKAGLSMVTSLFADRLAEYGIGVYEVRPGIIRTDMTAGVTAKYDALIEGGLTPIKRWGTPKDVADAVSLLCSGRLGFSTGDVLNVDGGFHIRRL
jgi:NAD(P)-dependent dehydrogenase (short-subunit alcohol dehydrogenase family)